MTESTNTELSEVLGAGSTNLAAHCHRAKKKQKRKRSKHKDRHGDAKEYLAGRDKIKNSGSDENEDVSLVPPTPSKKRKFAQPLRGWIISVSTLKGVNVSTNEEKGEVGNDASSAVIDSGYNAVCSAGKDLGAQVVSQVSKKVQLLVCSRSAVQSATQRVRKAHKKRIPIVDVAWLEECRKLGKKVELESFLLNKEASRAIKNRRDNLDAETDGVKEVDPNTGWTEPVSFGCSCVCHENGSEKDCKWCKDGCPC